MEEERRKGGRKVHLRRFALFRFCLPPLLYIEPADCCWWCWCWCWWWLLCGSSNRCIFMFGLAFAMTAHPLSREPRKFIRKLFLLCSHFASWHHKLWTRTVTACVPTHIHNENIFQNPFGRRLMALFTIEVILFMVKSRPHPLSTHTEETIKQAFIIFINADTFLIK